MILGRITISFHVMFAPVNLFDFNVIFPHSFLWPCTVHKLLVSMSLIVLPVLTLSGRTQKQVIDYIKEAEFKKHPFYR